MTVEGGCRCGAVRFEVALEALPLTYACHCLDCQTWSGSAFALHTMVPASLVQITGDVRRFRLDGAETMPSEHLACEACSTRIANYNDTVPGMIILRAGTLDRSADLVPAAHIWISRRQSWLRIAETTPMFEETPSPEAFAAALQSAG